MDGWTGRGYPVTDDDGNESEVGILKKKAFYGSLDPHDNNKLGLERSEELARDATLQYVSRFICSYSKPRCG